MPGDARIGSHQGAHVFAHVPSPVPVERKGESSGAAPPTNTQRSSGLEPVAGRGVPNG